MQCTEFVARRVAQISDVELHATLVANAGWIFAGRATAGDSGRVPGVNRFRAIGRKADGAAVANTGGVAVDRRGNSEGACAGPIEATSLVIDDACRDA